MKRVLVLLLCIATLLSFVACDNNNEEPGNQNNPSITDPVDKPDNTPDAPSEMIRPNGELPDNEHELTDAEKRHYVGIIVNAAITLDIETLREYAKNEKDLEGYQAIADDAVAREWYLKTIGKGVYLESSGALAHPEPEAVFQMWQTRFLKTNDVMPEDVTHMSLEELSSIYEQYQDKIPYVIKEVNPEYYCQIYLKEGRIYFELDELLGCTNYCYDIDDLTPSQYSWDGEYAHIAAMVFGHDAEETNNFQEFFEKNNMDFAMPMVNYDLDALEVYMDSLKDEHDWNMTPGKDDYAEKYYQAYIKDDAMRAKVQAWMVENVVCGFSGHGFDVWYTVNQDVYYQTFRLTEAERAAIQDLHICGWTYDGGYTKAEYVFSIYYSIISDMVEGGYIEDLV